jgi:hypothetical protein
MLIMDTKYFDDYNDPILIELSTCSICYNIFDNPYSKLCTYLHTFCHNCISAYNISNCPLCRQSVRGLNKNLFVSNVIYNLKRKCIFDNCSWVDRHELLSSHLNNDCEYNQFTCSCGLLLLRKDLKTHHNVCPEFKIICACDSVFKRSQLDHHKLICPFTPIECACKLIIQRSQLSRHQLVCPHALIECDFCKLLIPKTSKINHLKNACSRYPIECVYCAQTYMSNQKSYHDTICPDMVILCHCGKYIKRKNIDNH